MTHCCLYFYKSVWEKGLFGYGDLKQETLCISSKANNQKCILQVNEPACTWRSEPCSTASGSPSLQAQAPPASGLGLPRPPGMAGALSCSAALPSHSSGLGKFQWPGLKTSSAFLTVDCGFGSTLENLDLLQSNISWAWMLEKARAPWSGSYPMGTWMVLGLTGLRVWWCADNSWPGLMRFFMQVWDRMLGE